MSRNNLARPSTARAFGTRYLDYLLLVTGCIAYVAARNLTTRGEVKIDQFQYWLIGLLPFLIIVGAGKAYKRYAGADDRETFFAEGFFASAWLLSLLEFVTLRVTWRSEAFEFPLYRLFDYNYVFANLVLSVVYSTLGYATAGAIRELLSAEPALGPHRISGLIVGCLSNAVLFYLMVFSFTG